MSHTGSRADNRVQMQAAIRELGQRHLRTHGAAGLSLRAIARDLGVVSSAVYRYVPSRDELLTLLLVEGYTDLADAVDSAMSDAALTASDTHDADEDSVDQNSADQSGSTHRRAIAAGAQSAREWALADPARWALLYGSPVPGYSAPPDRTIEPGTRVVGRLLAEFGAACEAGELRDRPPLPTDTATAISADLAAVTAEFGVRLPEPIMIAVTGFWASMIGGISLEVFGQYGPDTFAHPELIFGAQIDTALSTLFR